MKSRYNMIFPLVIFIIFILLTSLIYSTFSEPYENKRIVISQMFGGLGDNLAYSTLPELYSNNGYDVYISNNNVVRNKEIYDLVWGTNPFIKGKCNDDEGTLIGSNTDENWPKDSNIYFMNRIEIGHGFEPTNLFPKVYYNPKMLDEYKNAIIIDITGVSSSTENRHKAISKIEEFLHQQGSTENVFVIGFKNKINDQSNNDNIDSFTHYKQLYIENIFNYCDILYSCSVFLTVFSGASILMSAIKRDNNTPYVKCWVPPEQNASNITLFHFPNIEYEQLY